MISNEEVARTADQLAASEHLKARTLKRAGFPVLYAQRPDGFTRETLHWSDPAERPEDRVPAGLPWVNLGKVARGEDSYGQTTTIDRSNYRSLRRDYPEPFTDLAYVNVDVLGAFVADLDDDLIGILVKLATEYPLYDEEDLSALESDEIYASVREYALADISGELSGLDRETWDELTEDQQADLFGHAWLHSEFDPEHDGLDVRWNDYEEMLPMLTDILRSARSHVFHDRYNAYATAE